jgi:DNA-binding NtrC family response regulator
MRLDLQSKLLRVIQEQEFERVGGAQMVRVDVRLIATTNRDLKAEVDAGRFRADLYYRLNVVRLRTPALRDRVEDIHRLARHFIQRSAEHLELDPPALPPETLAVLQAYSWPGNVRELSNAVERAVILSRSGVLEPSDFQSHLDPASVESSNPRPGEARPSEASPRPAPEAEPPFDLDSLERRAILRALEATGGNRVRAAKLLGISERTLRNKLNVKGPPLAS